MKLKSVRITLIFLLGSTIIFVLFLLMPTPNKVSNGFNRNLSGFRLSLQYEVANSSDCKNIVGTADYSFFLSTKVPGEIFSYSFDLKNHRRYYFNVPWHPKLAPMFITSVDSPYFYLDACNLPAHFVSSFANLDSVSTSNTDFSFVRTVHFENKTVSYGLGRQSALIRYFKVFDKKTGLSVFKPIQPALVGRDKPSQGILNYEKETKHLVFTFNYANHYLVMDTNLNTIHVGNTIDTGSSSPSKSIFRSIGGKMVASNINAGMFVNKNACVSNGKLFIRSMLKGDNEDHHDFDNNCVIDIYDLKKFIYLKSFYIPNKANHKLRSFQVMAKELIVLFDKRIAVYRIDI